MSTIAVVGHWSVDLGSILQITIHINENFIETKFESRELSRADGFCYLDPAQCLIWLSGVRIQFLGYLVSGSGFGTNGFCSKLWRISDK